MLGIVRTTRTERKRRKKKETEKDEEGGREGGREELFGCSSSEELKNTGGFAHLIICCYSFIDHSGWVTSSSCYEGCIMCEERPQSCGVACRLAFSF